MKTIFKIILIVFAGVIILIFGFSAFIMYQTRSTQEVIEEKYHSNGNLAMQKIKGYDCCEGFFEKTVMYDTEGRKIDVFGNQDGSRIKEIFRYHDSDLIFEGYYMIDNDSLTENFEVDNSSLILSLETEYYPNKRVKSKKQLSFYEKLNKRDTASFEIEKFDSLGQIIVDREYRKDRDYFWDEEKKKDTMIIQTTLIEDKLKKTIDIIEIEKMKIK